MGETKIMNVLLTTEFIKSGLVVPEGHSKIEYCDLQVRGLYIAVSRTSLGRGTFYYRWKHPERRVTVHSKIGRTDELDLKSARLKALAMKSDIHRGSDPQEQLRQKKAVPTFAEYWDSSYAPIYSVRKRSWRNDEAIYRNRLKTDFGDTRLDQITRQQIQRWHVSLKELGLAGATCDLHLQLVKHVLSTAVVNEVVSRNVSASVTKFREDNKRERYLQDDELVRLLRVLDRETNKGVASILKFLLASGLRVSEALTAEWRNVSLNAKTLTIEAKNSKSRKARHVPLNVVALAVLDKLPRPNGQTFLFRSSRGSQMKYISKVWQRIRKEAGIEDITLHMLRHSHAAYLASSGNSLLLIQKVLGHADSSTTLRYAHVSDKALQDASDTVARKITDAMSVDPCPEPTPAGTQTAEVIPIKPRAA